MGVNNRETNATKKTRTDPTQTSSTVNSQRRLSNTNNASAIQQHVNRLNNKDPKILPISTDGKNKEELNTNFYKETNDKKRPHNEINEMEEQIETTTDGSINATDGLTNATDGYTTVEPKTNKKSERPPAIKIRISQIHKKDFNSCMKVFNEITRCFKSYKLVIKFAEYARWNENILVIATDDIHTYNLISKQDKWPSNAFGRGIQIYQPRQLQTKEPTNTEFSFSIKGVDTSIQFEDTKNSETQTILSQLKHQGITKAQRSYNKQKNNEATSFIRLTTSNKETYLNYINKKSCITIGYQRFWAISEIKPLQCRNCQDLGHKYFDCPQNKPTCLQCGESHRVSACPNKIETNGQTSYTKTYCANCKTTDHNSCSRKCEKIKEHILGKIETKKETKSTQQGTKQNQIIAPNSNKQSNQQAQPHQKNSYRDTLINKQKLDSANTEINELKKEIQELKQLLQTLISSLGKSQLSAANLAPIKSLLKKQGHSVDVNLSEEEENDDE